MSPQPEQFGTLTATPILEGFGAEVTGVDFSVVPIPDDVLQSMIAIQDKFGVTVYRNTGLDDTRYVAFSKQLGELEICPKFNGPTQLPRFDDEHLFDAGNMDRDGTIVKKDSRRWHYNKGNALWHTDSSFNQFRSKYSILLAHLVPKEGGNTDFADVRKAYNDLPESKKAECRGLVVEHDLWHSRRLAAPEEFSKATHFEMSAKPPAFHTLVQKAPDGRDTIFIAAHAKCIVGWPADKGLALITELIDHCTQPQYTMSVKWHRPGDLVWWDNRASMHRATPFSDQMERRDMRRTTVFDDGPYKDGVAIGSMPAA